MKGTIWIRVFIVILTGALITGCAQQMAAKKTTYGFRDSENRVLIASQNTAFKNAVVENIIKGLENDRVLIDVVDLNSLVEISSDDYQAIIIINDYKFFSYNSRTTVYLKELNENEKNKIFLLTTAGSPHRVKENLDVDTISSASAPEKADDISSRAIQKINALLSNE